MCFGHWMSEPVGCPQVNRFDQVSGDGHQKSLAGDRVIGVPCLLSVGLEARPGEIPCLMSRLQEWDLGGSDVSWVMVTGELHYSLGTDRQTRVKTLPSRNIVGKL